MAKVVVATVAKVVVVVIVAKEVVAIVVKVVVVALPLDVGVTSAHALTIGPPTTTGAIKPYGHYLLPSGN